MRITKSPVRSLIAGSIVLFAAAIMFSCGNKSELTNHIPKEANVVMTVDVKSIGLKSLNFSELLSIDNLKKAIGSIGVKKDTAVTGPDIKNAGIDLMGKAYVFGKAGETGSYGAAMVALSDAKKFEEFVKQTAKDIVITEEGKYKFAASPDNKGVMVWNDAEVIVLFGSETPKETVLSLANLKKEETLESTNTSFKDSQKESSDIALWINFEDFAKLAPQYGASVASMNLKDTYMAASCNFEDGKVVVNSKYTTNPEMAEKYNFIRGGISNDVAGALPGKTVIGLIGLAIDMGKVYEHLEREKLLDAYAPMAMQMTGLTIKDLLTMFSGDMAVTLNGLEKKDVPYMDYFTGKMSTRSESVPDYTAVLGIANKDQVKQLLERLATAGMLTKSDKFYSFQDKVYVIEKGGNLIITGTEAAKNVAVDGKNDKLDSNLSSLLTSNASAFYLNFPNIPASVYEGGGAKMGENIKNTEIVDITVTGGGLKDNTSKGSLVVAFKEKGENSLITLGRVSKKFSEMMKEPVVADAEEEAVEVQPQSN